MNFIVGLPTIEKGHDSIWVIVDRLNKSTHFIPIKERYRPHHYAGLYIAQIIRLHGVPKSIVSDRGPQFVDHFWEHLYKQLGTQLICSSAYHPQTAG